MDVSVFVVCFLFISLGDMTMQFAQGQQAPNAAITTSQNPTIADVPCATARGLPGSCVERQYCDYSTYAIDLSLYAPKGYKKPCLEKETCCPFSSQIEAKRDTTLSWEDKFDIETDVSHNDDDK